MKIGFTGTRNGLTSPQREALISAIDDFAQLWPGAEFHHGDCVGADAEAHGFAMSAGLPVVIHPPSKDALRAFCAGAREVRAAKPYLARNRDIVTEADWVIATPAEMEERPRGGTWSTVRFARGICWPVMLIYPDGSTDGGPRDPD
jgi:hypothetical protein